jgi:SAM-dependent methyltransferase
MFRRWPIHPQWLLGAGRSEHDIRSALAGREGLVADVGCSDRKLSRFIGPNATYVGLDYPTTATGLYSTKPDVFANAESLPLRDRSIDVLIAKDVLEHVERPEQALREAARVLRAGGCLILWIPFMYPIHDAPFDFQRFTEHGLGRRLAAAGFDLKGMNGVGRPIETAALLACLSLADAAERILAQRRSLLPLVPFIAVSILCVNLAGWCLRFLPATNFMPFTYRVIAERRAD